jgi:hypothetical protein
LDETLSQVLLSFRVFVLKIFEVVENGRVPQSYKNRNEIKLDANNLEKAHVTAIGSKQSVIQLPLEA